MARKQAQNPLAHHVHDDPSRNHDSQQQSSPQGAYGIQPDARAPYSLDDATSDETKKTSSSRRQKIVAGERIALHHRGSRDG